jgi:hypothetical protein
MGLGRQVWVDDPHFQILYHIRHTATPPPGSAEDLRNLAGRVFAQNLGRGKPPWELWMLEGALRLRHPLGCVAPREIVSWQCPADRLRRRESPILNTNWS